MKFWIEKSVIKLWFVWLLGTAKVYNIMSTSFIQDLDVCFKDKAFVTCYQKAYSFRTLKYQGNNSSTLMNKFWKLFLTHQCSTDFTFTFKFTFNF